MKETKETKEMQETKEYVILFKIVLVCLLLGFSIGGLIFNSMKVGHVNIHSEKLGCEYVEKKECKQVWVRGGEK